MERYSRRELLALGGLAAAGSLAGCIGGAGFGSGSDGEADDAADGPTIETLDVGGSPGGTVAVAPAGEVVLLDFFATWCPPCRPQMAHLREIRSQFPDLHVLSITWEREAGAVRQFWTDFEGTWPVALDPEIRTGERYGVTRIPTLLVLDSAGEERWRHSGLAAAETIAEELRAAGA